MDITSDIQIEQTPFTFRGDEQALRDVVDGALYALPGSRITSRAYGAHLATDYLSFDDAAWRESYTETVRGVEVRRLRAIWIGDARLEGKGPSFSYRCAYIDRADDDDAARIELRWWSIRQRDDQSVSMRLHIKLSPVQAAATTGRIEAPALLRFAVDAIMQAIEKADREVQTKATATGRPSDPLYDAAWIRIQKGMSHDESYRVFLGEHLEKKGFPFEVDNKKADARGTFNEAMRYRSQNRKKE